MPAAKKTVPRPSYLKIVFILVAIVLGAVAISIGLRMLQPWMTNLQFKNANTTAVAPDMAYGGEGYAADMAVSRESLKAGAVAQSSYRPPVIPTTPTPGSDAEAFEVTTFSATIESKNLQESCAAFTTLKEKEYVIFENADENERTCTYTFKVAKTNEKEVLDLIKSMDPKMLNENTYTIKRILENIETQESVLKKKAESIETTLQEAIASYDEVARLARNARDTESLTKLMNGKIDLIQRLTNERLQNNAQLEELARAKVEQADQLIYTNFYVSITEDTFFNGRDLKESWEQAVRDLVNTINKIAQDITLGMAALLLWVVQYALYFILLLFVAKYGWQFAKYVWKK